MELMERNLIEEMAKLFEEDAHDADSLSEDVKNLIEMGFMTETIAALVALVYGLKSENDGLHDWIDMLEGFNDD